MARSTDRESLHVERVTWGDRRFAEMKRLELAIFGRTNDFASAGDIAAGEMTAYRRWERSSEFYVGRLRTRDSLPGEAVAIVRFLRHDPLLGLDSYSTLYDFRRARPPGATEGSYLHPESEAFFLGLHPGTVAELATQAVLPEYRHAGVIEVLWRSAIAACQRDGVRIWTMALVVPLFRWYCTMLPDALTGIGQVMPDYVGADSVPAMLALDHPLMDAVLHQYDRRLASTLFAASIGAHAAMRHTSTVEGVTPC